MLDFDNVVGGFSSQMSIKILPKAARSGLSGRAGVSSHSQRLVADLNSTIGMRKSQFENFLNFHDVLLKNGREKFNSPVIENLFGADRLVLMFKDEPKLSSFDTDSGSLDISLRLIGRVVQSKDFDLCRYVLKRGLSVSSFSKSHNVEFIGGDISRTGAYFGDQYTVDCNLKLYQEDFENLVSWYLVTLNGGSEKFAVPWLADLDQRLINKSAMIAGGLDCQFSNGVVNVKLRLWVVNDAVTIGTLVV